MRKLLKLAAAALAVAALTGAGVAVRGYTNGKECYYANCATLPTVLKRMECCDSSCPGTWYIECVNEAVGGDPSESLRTLAWAARTIDYATPFSLPGDIDRAATFFVACARSTNPVIARAARALADESNRLTAILKALDPHNEQGRYKALKALVLLDVPGVGTQGVM